VIDGVAFGIDRRAVVFAIVEIAFLVVGQRREVGQILKPPGLVIAAMVEQHLGQRQVELRNLVLVVVLGGQRHGLDHELERPHAVALDRVHHVAAAAVRTAFIFARDQEPLVLGIEVLLRGGMQEPPVLLVNGDRALEELVKLVDPAEVVQALRGVDQILADLLAIGLLVQAQLAKAVVSLFEVPVVHELLRTGAKLGFCGRLGKRRRGEQPDQNQAEPRQTEESSPIHNPKRLAVREAKMPRLVQ
jgi:hypothetical protein